MSRTYYSYAWALVLLAQIALFHFWGSAVRGYIDTASIFLWWGKIWVVSEDSRHGPLLLLVAGWLFWRNLKKSDQPQTSSPWLGAFWIGVGLLLHVFGFLIQQTRVSCVAFLLSLYGLAWLGGGPRYARSALFPLGVMLLALPLEAAMEEFSYYLRAFVIRFSHDLSTVCGFEVIRSGTQLYSASGAYQYDVAPACSGIRSLSGLVAISLVVGYVAFTSFWRRAVVVGLAVPFALIGNVIRIFAIILAAEWFGESAGNLVHEYFGFVIFLIVFGLSLLAISVIDRWAPEKKEEPGKPERAGAFSSPSPKSQIIATVGCLLLVALTAGGLSIAKSRGGDFPAGIHLTEDGQNPVPLPRLLAPHWVGKDVEVTQAERDILPPDTGYSRKLYSNLYGDQVFVSIVLSGRDRSSIHRPEVCLTAQGWTIEERTETTVRLESTEEAIPATKLKTRMTLPSGREVESIFVYWFVSSDEVMGSNMDRMITLAKDKVFRLKSHRWAYVYAQSVIRKDEEHSLQLIEEVWNETVPVFQKVNVKN